MEGRYLDGNLRIFNDPHGCLKGRSDRMGIKRLQQFGMVGGVVILMLLLNSGCAPPRKIYAKYTLPPSGVAEFLPLKNAQIEKPLVEIRGNWVGVFG